MLINPAKLDFWIKNNLNVLFVGKHGVGKTSIIISAFQRNNLIWKYYSASTLDPWVDFIGVPREQKNEQGVSYLDLVRPIEWAEDKIQAIFMDEYNRSSTKIRNAVMELIQFKSINGKKFNNLKIIWVACNPDDEEDLKYSVEKLDPAQEDRFHIKVEIPYKPDRTYFTQKYGSQIAEGAIEWWSELPKEVKDKVSPRRLDYALDIYKLEGDIRDVLPTASNISKLIQCLSVGSINKILDNLIKSKDDKAKAEFFANENNFSLASPIIEKNQVYKPLFKFYPNEKISQTLQNSPVMLVHAMSEVESDKDSVFIPILRDIITANKNEKFVKIIKKKFRPILDKHVLVNIQSGNTAIVSSNNSNTAENVLQEIKRAGSIAYMTSQNKKVLYSYIYNNIPSGTTTYQDVEILSKILNVCLSSNRQTLQDFTGPIELIELYLCRILQREQIKDLAEYTKFIKRSPTKIKDFNRELNRFTQRNKQLYSDILRDINFYWYNPTINYISTDSTSNLGPIQTVPIPKQNTDKEWAISLDDNLKTIEQEESSLKEKFEKEKQDLIDQHKDPEDEELEMGLLEEKYDKLKKEEAVIDINKKLLNLYTKDEYNNTLISVKEHDILS